MKNIPTMIVCGLLVAGGCAGQSSQSDARTGQDVHALLVGSYSEPGDRAMRVYAFDMSTKTGEFRYSLPVDNASYIALGGNGNVYVVSESDDKASSLTALRPDSVAGVLKVVNSQPVGSGAPCYVNISPDGRFVVTANYSGGTAAVFPLAGDGSLLPRCQLISFDFEGGTVAGRQEASHPHCVAFTPDGKFMLVDDLGNDCIHQFALHAGADTLVSSVPDKVIELEPGSGPRHIVFDHKGEKAYLINELSDKVTVLSYDGDTLKPLQYIAANTVNAGGAADIHISPDGRHLYASLRLANDGIACFDIEPDSGLLKYRGHTATPGHPRNFTISPNGRLMLVACRDGNVVKVYDIDTDGSLSDTGNDIKVDKPVFVSFY